MTIPTEWIAPLVGGIVAVVVAALGGFFAWRNAKTGAREQRAPDVMDAWAEADQARKLAYFWQDLYYFMRGMFKSFARKVTEQYPEIELTPEERAALEREPDPHKEKS